MKTKIFISLALTVICFSCSFQKTNSDDRSVEGNWYYIDPLDESYNELYFSKELFIHNLHAGAIGPVFHYLLINDSIYIDGDKNFLYKEFLFTVNYEDDKIVFQDKDGKQFQISPLASDVFDWGGLVLKKKQIDSLRKGWFIRSDGYLYGETEIDTLKRENDTLDIPPWED